MSSTLRRDKASKIPALYRIVAVRSKQVEINILNGLTLTAPTPSARDLELLDKWGDLAAYLKDVKIGAVDEDTVQQYIRALDIATKTPGALLPEVPFHMANQGWHKHSDALKKSFADRMKLIMTTPRAGSGITKPKAPKKTKKRARRGNWMW